jgi:hypothetical protein
LVSRWEIGGSLCQELLDRLSHVRDDRTEPVTVRAATAADASAIRSIYAPLVTDTFASFEEFAPDDAEFTRLTRT